MQVTALTNSIYHVRFRAQHDLTKTFVRLQEYFESPHFRGHYFSLKEFRQWYITHSPEGKKTGKFTFYHDLEGFNIPSTVLVPFYQGQFSPLTNEERLLLLHFEKLYPTFPKDGGTQRFYIIGTYGNHTVTALQHEIAHALFYLNKRYRQEVLHILHTLTSKQLQQLNHYFAYTRFYHPDVWLDESHTYLLTALDMLKEEAGMNIALLQPLHEKLTGIFKRYYHGEK